MATGRRTIHRPIGRVIGVLISASAVACAVSFDGYELDAQDASIGGKSGAAGSAAQGGSAGKGSGGTVGGGGKSGSAGATGGNDGTGGNDAAGGSAGIGGSDGLGGASGANGTGGSGGSGGIEGAGGTGGSGGASGGSGGAGGSGGGTGGTGGTGGGTGGTGGSGGGTGGTGGSVTCPTGLPGPSMILVDGTYCIDSTEVTNQQYGAFLFSSPPTSGQIAACSWNTSYAPATSSDCAAPLPYDPTGKAFRPVSCIDWCDAYRYCELSGKRLCGRVGGGSTPTSGLANAGQSQWYNACSAGGARRYPYGSQYQNEHCNGIDNIYTNTVNVASLAFCQGGVANLYDMSGNVREWEDGCNGSSGQSDGCPQRGGGYLDDDDVPPITLECTNAPLVARDNRSNQRGFRCCWDG